MTRGGDHTPLVMSLGKDLSHASLLLRAMENDRSPAGLRFNGDLEALYRRWERLIRVLASYNGHALHHSGPPPTLDGYAQWMRLVLAPSPRQYPRPRPLTIEEQEEFDRRQGIFEESNLDLYRKLQPYTGNEENDRMWEMNAKEFWVWVADVRRNANPYTRWRTSKRVKVEQYFNEVRDFCGNWRLKAWWAGPSILQSHSLRAQTGLDSLMGIYMVGTWSPPEYMLVAQLPGTSSDAFERDRQRFSDGYLGQTIKDKLGDIQVRWEPTRAEMREIEDRYGAACVIIRWDGRSHYRSASDSTSSVTVSEYIMEECGVRLRRPLTKREKEGVRHQLAPQLYEGRQWFRSQGWTPTPHIDLETHARWVASRLLDPSRSWSAITEAGSDIFPSVLRSCHRFADRASLTLP